MKEFKARKWQEEAIKRSLTDTSGGIFLEAAGGRGKTLCALEIAKQRKAKNVIVVNNRVSILSGWEKSYNEFGYNKSFELVAITDKKLSNIVKEGSKMACDVLIIDEWQNVSSDKNVRAYAKIKRKYTIGLSATPVRKKGQNFYPLEKPCGKKQIQTENLTGSWLTVKWCTMLLHTQKPSGQILETMRATFLICQTSCGGKK